MDNVIPISWVVREGQEEARALYAEVWGLIKDESRARLVALGVEEPYELAYAHCEGVDAVVFKGTLIVDPDDCWAYLEFFETLVSTIRKRKGIERGHGGRVFRLIPFEKPET